MVVFVLNFTVYKRQFCFCFVYFIVTPRHTLAGLS